MNWIKVNLLDIAKPKQWKNISMTDLTEDGYPVYGANGIIGKYPEYNHEFPTLAITCRGATCGSLNITEPKSYINSNAMALDDLNPNVDLQFLYYALGKRGFKDVVSGSAQPQITREGLSNIFIDIPEKLADQIKIANVLSRAEALIKQRKENIELLDEFLKSTFNKMFGDPIRNEKDWATKTVEQLVKKQKYSLKRGPFGGALKKEIFVPNGYLVYEQYHALNNDFTFERYFIDEAKFQELKAFEVFPNDIIISCSGIYLGKLAIVPPNAKRGIINQALLKITLDNSVVNNQFFVFLFSHGSFKKKFYGNSIGSGIPNFPPMDEFKKFQFIYPSIELQNKFAVIVEKTEALKVQLKNGLNDLENLYGSLSQKAFKGVLDLSALDVFIKEEEYQSFSNDRTEPHHFPPPENVVKKKEEPEDKRYGDPFEVDEATAKKQGGDFYKQWKELHPVVKPHKFYGGGEATISWEWLANRIKERYEDKHFNFEMLMNLVKKEKLEDATHYYSSEEMKANPKLNETEDLKTFIQTAVVNVLMDEEQTRKVNPFLKVKQSFYNAEKENFQLNLHKEDFKLLKNKTAKQRSGIYFNVEQ